MRTNSAKQLFVLNDLLISDPIEVSATDKNRVAAVYPAILRSMEETLRQSLRLLLTESSRELTVNMQAAA